jgi:hypothetical protein
VCLSMPARSTRVLAGKGRLRLDPLRLEVTGYWLWALLVVIEKGVGIRVTACWLWVCSPNLSLSCTLRL